MLRNLLIRLESGMFLVFGVLVFIDPPFLSSLIDTCPALTWLILGWVAARVFLFMPRDRPQQAAAWLQGKESD
ncbi:MAG: hypothetical protein U9N45_06530 [Gemmatimonadota bacterium]|nr:hypothetical protein [Gemmatimonadota bacterium]